MGFPAHDTHVLRGKLLAKIEAAQVPVSMFWGYEEKEELEDELYAEAEDSSGSEVDSEVEFRLYSQLHYSKCLGEEEEEEEEKKQEEEPSRPQVREQQPNGVIVISSDTEVITVSDGTEEEEEEEEDKEDGKGAAYRTRRSSASPAEKGLGLSESESDSDGVEAWMVLGQEKQESDKTIQLNLEGAVNVSSADEEDVPSWGISKRDEEAQISNQRPGQRRTPNRYYTTKSITCRSCNKTGHLSKNCPTPKKPSCTLCGSQRHLQKTCPNRHCYNCSLPGHCYDDCLDRAYWHKQCHRCGMTGHFFDACPDIWRQYHLTTRPGPVVKPAGEEAHRDPAYCYNCSRKGHFGFECSQRRMFNGTFPTAPYVSYYDTPQDVRQRVHRARRKAQELQEAGLLPPSGADHSAWLPGGDREEEEPPRKRAKTKNKAWEKKRKDGASPAKPQKVKEKKKKKQKQKQQEQQQQPPQQKKTKAEKRKVQKRSAKERRQLKQRETQAWHGQAPQRAAPLADEDDDFPRGPKRRRPGASTADQRGKPVTSLFGPGKQVKKRRPRGRDRKPGNQKLETMYPTDENLFIIKQKRKS
ncbi:hypothetical protein AAFF_G00180320 [Aldrovandia affinis]|uniref:Zinc finger CCHC domain-containing protein 7 n=1 Tax=Aldrovandia affinis TaxID=143900 RepID=A0AAD7WVQ2_9TELE|nr:hypothetical protein AAFF_G00180320 [Aldrovandia affinis]